MILFVGMLVLFLGLLSGGVLVLASFGVLTAEPGLTLWITFPLLCLIGFALAAVQATPAIMRAICLASSAVLLLLALASIAALVLGSAALVRAPISSAPLWFVFVIGTVLGAIGAASFGRAAAAA